MMHKIITKIITVITNVHIFAEKLQFLFEYFSLRKSRLPCITCQRVSVKCK